MVRNFVVPRYSGAASAFRVSPPGMAASLTNEFAAIVDEVSNQVAAFHGNMGISSKDSPAADFASSRFNSIASDNASRRFAISSSRVSPWQFTPGISSIHPIHHGPSCRITAVYPVADNFFAYLLIPSCECTDFIASIPQQALGSRSVVYNLTRRRNHKRLPEKDYPKR